LAGTLAIANGGTGASSASAARTNLVVPSTTGTGASGTWNIDITGNAATATALTGVLAVINGGTGVTTSTGTGAVVLGTSPTLTTPNLGTPSTLVGTNITGTSNSFVAGIGVNQTWQNVAGSRSSGVTYTNSTGKPIMVQFRGSGSSSIGTFTLGGIYAGSWSNGGTSLNWTQTLFVPVGATYAITLSAGSIETWLECRA
jgi:hypothetical protein